MSVPPGKTAVPIAVGVKIVRNRIPAIAVIWANIFADVCNRFFGKWACLIRWVYASENNVGLLLARHDDIRIENRIQEIADESRSKRKPGPEIDDVDFGMQRHLRLP